MFHSSAILADAIHDFGDALIIGSSILMQKYSNKSADNIYPFGYKRWNAVAALLTSLILILGTAIILIKNIPVLLYPQPVKYNGMLVLGFLAIIINVTAFKLTKNHHSHNESILNLHFLEDMLGWLAIIIVSIIIRFTDWYILDPLLSIIIAIVILYKACPIAWTNSRIFLETTPNTLVIPEIQKKVTSIPSIVHLEKLQIWTLDGYEHCATLTLKLVEGANSKLVKQKIRLLLHNYAIEQITIETL